MKNFWIAALAIFAVSTLGSGTARAADDPLDAAKSLEVELVAPEALAG